MYEDLVRYTPCPYAVHAQWIEVPPIFVNDNTYLDVEDAVAATCSLAPYCELDGLDMLVVPLLYPQLHDSIRSLKDTTRTFIFSLTNRDECESYKSLASTTLLSFDWRLLVNGVPIFALAFSSLYPRLHPRYSPDGNGYLVLQLEASFTRHGISGGLAAGRLNLSRHIQRCFEARGFHYYSELTRHAPKSLRLIKPVTPQTSAIDWWNTKD